MKKVVTFCFSSRYKQCNWNSQLCRLLTNHTNSSIPQFFGTYHYGVTHRSRPTIEHPPLCQGIPCHAEQRSERQRKSGGSVVSAATSKRTGGLLAQQYFAIITLPGRNAQTAVNFGAILVKPISGWKDWGMTLCPLFSTKRDRWSWLDTSTKAVGVCCDEVNNQDRWPENISPEVIYEFSFIACKEIWSSFNLKTWTSMIQLFYHPPTTSCKFTLDINVYRFFCPRKGWWFYDILICFLHGGLHSCMILLFHCWVDGSPADFPKPLRSSSASATYSARHPRTSQSSVTSRSRSLSSGWIKMMIQRITKVKQ